MGHGWIYNGADVVAKGPGDAHHGAPDEQVTAVGRRDDVFDEVMVTAAESLVPDLAAVGVDLPVQDLDELAEHALQGIRDGDFVIMIGRERMEAQLIERAKKLAQGECPTGPGWAG